MSISRKCCVGYGYLLSAEDVRSVDPMLRDDLLDSDYMHRLDGYDDNTNYFFGIVYVNAEEGCAIEVKYIGDYAISPNTMFGLTREFDTYFPQKLWDICKTYLLNIID